MMYEENELEEFAPWLVIIITLVGGLLRVFLLDSKGCGWMKRSACGWPTTVLSICCNGLSRLTNTHPFIISCSITGSHSMGIRPMMSVCFLHYSAQAPSRLLPDRQTHVWCGDGLAAAVILALSPFNIRFAQETRMYTCLTFNAAVAIYALVRLLTDSRSVRPIGSQFREYLHAWRTSGPVEPDIEGEFSYKVETRNQSGWRAWIFRHRWLPIQTLRLTWPGLHLWYSRLRHAQPQYGCPFPLATNIFVLGLMLFQRIKKSGSLPPSRLPLLELGEGSDWHLLTMESMDIRLYQSGQQSLSGVLAPKPVGTP